LHFVRDIIVLGGGASVLEYQIRNLERLGYLIAVNDAAIYTKPDVADRLWLEGRQLLLKALVPPMIYYRRGTPKNFTPPEQWIPYEHDEGYPTLMTRQQGKLNGSNSGTCAINLAFQLRPHRVFLLGFDMQHGPAGELHWYPDYSWGGGSKKGTLREWANEFADIAKQFESADIPVFNVNHRSLIRAFETISYENFLRATL
jgi:hypothetical protein